MFYKFQCYQPHVSNDLCLLIYNLLLLLLNVRTERHSSHSCRPIKSLSWNLIHPLFFSCQKSKLNLTKYVSKFSTCLFQGRGDGGWFFSLQEGAWGQKSKASYTDWFPCENNNIAHVHLDWSLPAPSQLHHCTPQQYHVLKKDDWLSHCDSLPDCCQIGGFLFNFF